MKKIEVYSLILNLLLLFIFFCIFFSRARENRIIIKELKDLNSTLEYIDNRMDTLEFFRIPEKKK